MSEIDRKRIAAVRLLEGMGYTFGAGEWKCGGGTVQLPEADAMHALLVDRADQLAGRAEGSPEEIELAAIDRVVQAYEVCRWPRGKEAGGKG
jgi:hypothetical protein